MAKVPFGLTEALGMLTLSHEGPLLEGERVLLERTYHPMSRRAASAAVLIGLAIGLLAIGYRMASLPVYTIGFLFFAVGIVLAFACREFLRLHRAMRSKVFRVYGTDKPLGESGRRTSQIIARPDGTPVFVFGHLATPEERERLGPRVFLAGFEGGEDSRALTPEEKWELADRVAQFKSSWMVASLLVAVTILMWNGYGEKIGLGEGWILPVVLTFMTLGVVRVAFRAIRVVPRLQRDIKLAQVDAVLSSQLAFCFSESLVWVAHTWISKVAASFPRCSLQRVAHGHRRAASSPSGGNSQPCPPASVRFLNLFTRASQKGILDGW